MIKKITAGLALLVTTFFWGVTFTLVKEAITHVDVFVFLAQRFLLAFLLMLPIGLLRHRFLTFRVLKRGGAMGLFLFASYAFQTVALRFTSASNTGFLTGLNVVFVPVICAFLFRQKIPRNVIGAVILSVIGLFLLCTNGALTFNNGDILASICAFCVALHLILTGRYAGKSDVYWLTTVQLGTVALLNTAVAGMSGYRVFDWHPELLWTLAICVLFATVFAFLVQTSMQRFLSPSHTALIFCMEPVFAALYAYWAMDERLGLYGFVGAVLIFAGMIVSELSLGRNGAEEPAFTVGNDAKILGN